MALAAFNIPGSTVFLATLASKTCEFRSEDLTASTDYAGYETRARRVKHGRAQALRKWYRLERQNVDNYRSSIASWTRSPSNPDACSAASTPQRKTHAMSVMVLTAPVIWDITGTDLERSMFRHARSCAIPDFGSETPSGKLWINYILPLGYYSDAVKYAIIAFGIAHRAFLDGPQQENNAAETKLSLDISSKRYYQKAISEVIKVMNCPSPADIPIILVCCLVFVCYEFIQGEPEGAIEHLKSGIKLLESIRHTALANALGTAPFQTHEACVMAAVKNHFAQLCDIAGIFSCIGLDISMGLQTRVGPDMSFFMHGELGGDSPFSDVADAQYHLHLVELMLSDGRNELSMLPADEFGSASFTCPENHAIDSFVGWHGAAKQFERWCARFDAFEENLPHQTREVNREELLTLRLLRKGWELCIRHFLVNEGLMYEWKMHRLVDMAENIVDGRGSRSRPLFSDTAHIIPSLSYICVTCGNYKLERRCIDVLRKMKKREGLWDSEEIVEALEFILVAKRDNQWKDEYLVDGLPTFAKRIVGTRPRSI
ncbi:C6 zinc finger domain protein [Colletotrichum truncatum]|uniref:C6 zinc finger domain protein n=1 Tax=Colletotrichum truncatum TaxID=5467 RepID=A0ACC3Z0C7_COLTU|nr:C6 zinc finger domain protein [Colletotrichum truncatum]KAF6800693.1 C6 zinc finger domain protein [Colletotrichum truncatum]